MVQVDEFNRAQALITFTTTARPKTIKQFNDFLVTAGMTAGVTIEDLERYGIYKVAGEFRHIPELNPRYREQALAHRLSIAVITIKEQGDLVVIDVDEGAGAWVAAPLRSAIRHGSYLGTMILGLLVSDSEILLVCREGKGKQVEEHCLDLVYRGQKELMEDG